MIVLLEGIDGSGKTYALQYLEAQLKKENYSVRSILGSSFEKGSGQLEDISKSPYFNLGTDDIKQLLYITRHVSCWHDMIAFDSQNPDVITLKDRGWLSALVYSSLFKYRIRNSDFYDKILLEYIRAFPAPNLTFCFLPTFCKSRVSHRQGMKDYYNNFDGLKIFQKYKEAIRSLSFDKQDDFVICAEDKLEEFDTRNQRVLKIIKSKFELLKNIREERK